MSISPSMVVASLPVLRLASQTLKVALETGADFASHLGGVSKASGPEGDTSNPSASRSRKLDELVPRLQQFLKSLGPENSSAIELQTTSQGTIQVAGVPEVKQAVDQWMKENPDWTKAWQTAAKEFLSESPPRFPGEEILRANGPPTLSLRSRIDAGSAEHSY